MPQHRLKGAVGARCAPWGAECPPPAPLRTKSTAGLTLFSKKEVATVLPSSLPLPHPLTRPHSPHPLSHLNNCACVDVCMAGDFDTRARLRVCAGDTSTQSQAAAWPRPGHLFPPHTLPLHPPPCPFPASSSLALSTRRWHCVGLYVASSVHSAFLLGAGLGSEENLLGVFELCGKLATTPSSAAPAPPRPTTPPPPPPPLVSVSNRPTHHGGHVPAACKDGPDRGGGCLCVEGGKSSYLCPLFVGGQQLPSTPPHPPPPCPQPHPAGPRATGVALPVVPQRPLKVRSGVGWRPWDLVCCCVCPVPPRSRCGVEGNGRPSPAPERPSAASHHAHCLEVVAAGTGDPPPPPPPPSWPRTSGL